ncbi:hypothetical protein DL764_005863 [Monosporascus ibericus]|uniref:FAD-binding domain-containing protein n=1 Tax=Monosporascus ibericus TaxID=155417 RepID=A0A4Q4T753_9PEZI|nr:hypothetical protein DL764_005863 [Monosporascus ibericus]
MASNNFKVVIVGGSVAGLTLALMLEQNGIDFVVLEAYPEIAPQVGASISILPNGMRTLDQLGCHDSIMEKAEDPVDKVYFRSSTGQEISSIGGRKKTFVQQHGYPIVFLDRKMVLESLYDKIQDKSKILTSERVMAVENNPESAVVTTKTGKEFTGDIVIGADGIHSKVRQEMWRDAQKKSPSWINPAEQQDVPCTFVCIFGISEGVQGIEKGTLTSVYNEHFSYLVPSGPGDRTYWFLVRNLGKTVYGDDIPRFTKEEEVMFAREHFDDQITPTLKFSDLYNNKVSSTYTALPEYVYKRWYFNRIMTVGDSCHKFEPLTGQGGNSAIETAASLINHLVAALRENPNRPLSTAKITQAFEATQLQRQDRVWNMVRKAHSRQRVECLETPVLKFLAVHVLPRVPESMIQDQMVALYAPTVSLDMLPHPPREHAVPYYDELLRRPRSRGWVAVSVLSMAYLLLAFGAMRMLFTAGGTNGTFGFVRDTVRTGIFSEGGALLRHTYTGVSVIDRSLLGIVAVFLPAVTGASGLEQQLQLIYFLSAMLPIVALMTIEGFRPRNSWTMLALPSIWCALFQIGGIGFIGQLYFLFSIFTTRTIEYFLCQGMGFPLSTARATLPAVVIGFIVPTVLMFLPTEDLHARQGAIAMWQAAPVAVSLLTSFFSLGIGLIQRKFEVDASARTGRLRVVVNLQNTYKLTGAIAAAVHVAVMVCSIMTKNLSLASIFLPKGSSFAPSKTLGDGIFIFFQNDFLFVAFGSLLWGAVTMWDLHRLGLSNMSPFTAVCAIVVASVAVGPGAAMAAVWYWREDAMSGAMWKTSQQMMKVSRIS